jgi:hypothetical protein
MATTSERYASTSSSATISSQEALSSIKRSLQRTFEHQEVVSSSIQSSEQKKGALTELLLNQEVLSDVLSRPKEFHSRPETLEILDEVNRQIFTEVTNRDETIQQLTQSLAPKLAFAYIQHGMSSVATDVVRTTTSHWTLADEDNHRDLWKPVVTLFYSRRQYQQAVDVIDLLTQYADISGSWMQLARLQALLRMAEWGKQTKEISSAESLWELFEKRKEEVPRSVLVLILDSQIKRGDVEKVKKTLGAMEQHSLSMDLEMWRSLHVPLLRLRKSRDAILQLLLRHTVDITSIVEKLIHHYSVLKDVRNCIKTLRMFGVSTGSQKRASITISVTPTLQMYYHVMCMFARSAQPDNAIRFLSLALASNCEGDYTYPFVEVAYALNAVHRGEDALYIGGALTDTLMQYRFPRRSVKFPNKGQVMVPSSRFYSVLLQSVATLDSVGLIVPITRSILLEIFSKDKKLKNTVRRSLSRILVRLCTNATPRQLEKVIDGLKTTRPNGEDAQIEAEVKRNWDLFLETLYTEGLADQFSIRVWQKMSRSEQRAVKEEVTAVSSIPFGDDVKIEDAFREDTAPQYISLVDFNALDLTTKLSPAAYTMRLRVYAVIRRDYIAAQIIYQSMRQHGVEASMHHISPIVEGLVLSHRIDDAERVKKRAMKEIPYASVGSRMYGALCRGYRQLNNWKAICDIAEEMRERKIPIHQSFASGFQQARRMLQMRARYQQAEEGDGGGGEELESSLQLERVLHDEKLWELKASPTVKSATWVFQEYIRTRRPLQAHEHIAKAFKRGVLADSVLRDLLKRSSNYLTKQIEALQLRPDDLSTRVLRQRTRALELCKANQVNARATEENLALAAEIFQAERVQRRAMIKLLQEAIASKKLWDEAHSEEYKERLVVIRRRRLKQKRQREKKKKKKSEVAGEAGEKGKQSGYPAEAMG